MMKILFIPIRSAGEQVNYIFGRDLIQVTANDMKDTFDFRDFPDGVLDVESIETDLPFNPIISAKRENGVLWVELLNFIGMDASESERFPEWVDWDKVGWGEKDG